MCHLVSKNGGMLLYNYLNTFIGEIFWLHHINKKDFPIKPLVFPIFIAKFMADAFAISVYFGRGPLMANIICVALPILDFAFIITYLQKHLNMKSF